MATLTDKQYLELAKLSYLYEGAFVEGVKRTPTRTPTLEVLADKLLDSKEESDTDEDTDTDTDTVREPIPFVAPGKTENGFMSDEDFQDTLKYIQNDPILSRLVLLEYFNDNANTGFAGIALSGGVDRYFAFTGSEGGPVPFTPDRVGLFVSF